MNRTRKQLRVRRRGITLIEVLFAVGVVVIGLLGVVALIPLAGSQARKGIENDRAAIIGRSAIQTFDIYKFRHQASWTFWNPGTNNFQPFNPWNSAQFNRPESFCIDPMFIGTQGAGSSPLSLPTTPIVTPANPDPTVRQVSQWFPYGDVTGFPSVYAGAPGDVRMRRITLRSFPSSPIPMTLAQAKHLFMSKDDLSFFNPEDDTLDPRQDLGNLQRRRQSKGAMSYMVTLAPKSHLQLTPVPHEQQLYIMSVVVFARRDVNEISIENERVTRVRFFNQGFAGGEIRVYGQTEKSVDVQSDDWVMLAANSNVGRVFRWYRVLACDFEPIFDGTLGVWSREVTLQGPDWGRREWHHPFTPLPWPVQIGAGYPQQPYVTNAILLKGIIGVYEKTVRLERSSLWSN